MRGMFECLLENYRDLFVGMDRCPCYSLTTADKTNLDHDMDVPLVKLLVNGVLVTCDL